uniref:HHLA2 member of B7 family n=1 Tax=Strigops habroptila TaxID=2489341 RepID=A0A672UKQ2_STRHB
SWVHVPMLCFAEQETVTGLFSKDCILPCLFPPGDDEVIYWKKGDKYVHSYYYQTDQLEGQDPDYRHRTHLFHENIPSGNASLKLSNLTLTDEGPYNCYVGTQQTRTEVEVMLHIRVTFILPNVISKDQSLQCYAFLTYSAPRISWVRGNTSIQETGQKETRHGVLYSLRSDQNIINTGEPYYCHIQLPDEEWTAEWKMQGRNKLKSLPASLLNVTAGFRAKLNPVFLVVWTLHRNAAISVLAFFNGTSHSYQPRVQINQSDFSLILNDLTANDSGEYLCNVSTPHYTKLTVRTLEVGKLLLFPFWRWGPQRGTQSQSDSQKSVK